MTEEGRKEIEDMIIKEGSLNQTVATYLIHSFENFKEQFQGDRNHDEADDYILYLRAEHSMKREDFKYYLEESKNKVPLNIDRAKDGLLYLDALQKGTIDALTDYLRNSQINEFKSVADKDIRDLEKANQVTLAFDKIQNFTGDINEAIKLCNQYLIKYDGYNKEYDEIVTEKKRKVN
ncbi:MAG: hypothetical protein AAFP82_06795 [Bacteroidota bacterium]